MYKIVSTALLAGGLGFIVLGICAPHSLNHDASRFFIGSPRDIATWMVIGGLAAAAIGLAGTMRTRNQA